MRKFILIFIHVFCVKSLWAQFTVIQNASTNTLYSGVENKLNIVVENSLCKSLIVRATNGKIIGENCQYIFTTNLDSIDVNLIKNTEINVFKRTNKNQLILLKSKTFVIKKVPNPLVCILSCNNLNISYLFLRGSKLNDGHPKVPDIRAELPLSYSSLFDCRFVVDSFYISIFRNDTCIVKPMLNRGNFFEQATQEPFNLLIENDKIVFDKIYVTGSDGSKRILPLVAFTVTK